METMDPHIVQVLAIAVAAAAMIVLSQAKGVLQARPQRRRRAA